MAENPFSALFNSSKAVAGQQNIKVNSDQQMDEAGFAERSKGNAISLIERLLLVSTRDIPLNFSYVYLPDSHLEPDSIDMILFERLLLTEPQKSIKNLNSNPNFKEEQPAVVGRSEVVLYLFDVYERCWKHRKEEDVKHIQNVKNAVITNLSTALEEPDVYDGQKPHQQFEKLILDQLPSSDALMDLINKLLIKDCQPNNPHEGIFIKIIEEVTKRLNSCSLMSIDWNMVEIVSFYASSSHLAPILLRMKKSEISGRHYQFTVLGSLLSISCLPKSFEKPFEFFENPQAQSMQVHKNTESSIGVALRALHNRLHKIFLTLLKISPNVKDQFMRWLESCLTANAGRGGLWHLQAGELQALAYVSDSFMVNLGSVMLLLCFPFIKDVTEIETKDYKILKVHPTYCSPDIISKKMNIQGLYSADMSQQSFLMPLDEMNEESISEDFYPTQYSFITSCFFLTHRALHLGHQVVQQRLYRVSQELGRLEHEFREIVASGSPTQDMIKKHMESRTTKLLCMKAAIFEAETTERLLLFLSATSIWLTQIAIKWKAHQMHSSYQEISLKEIRNTEAKRPLFLKYIPEFFIETLVGCVNSINRYNREALTLCNKSVYSHLLTFIGVFMGSSELMSNPHLRAHLAECLETLIPHENDTKGLLSTSQQRILLEHPLSLHLVTAIIEVFVSIEMTGQSVAFEEKFNYRRPMYEIMKYFWEIPSHKDEFIRLAKYSLMHMESAKPPLFLRFVNLLINDAIFLLDEGLSYMTQLRELQIERDNNNWQNLSDDQRGEREESMRNFSLNARFHNMLGSCTIDILVKLTSKIPELFTHGTLVERMAAMLNHFLQHLVGPKQRDLKVRDMEKYQFRPGEIVSGICNIYNNLYTFENFCLAVSADGRSYNPELFIQASNILIRIGRMDLSIAIKDIGELVKKANQKREEAEDLASTAPEEYLDPIMQHLMTDPVKLPSSGITVDRQTIARHLLSDQNDPFNRQPLTMEEVIPDIELKERINTWLEERRKEKQQE